MNLSAQRLSGEARRAWLGESIAPQIAAALDSETSSEKLLDEIERFNRKKPGKAFWKAALRHEVIPVELARAFIVLYLRTWQDGGRETLLNLLWLPELSGDAELCRRLSVAFECAEAIADSGDADAWVNVPALLEELATGQDFDGRPIGAAYLRLYAAQVTTEPTDAIQFAERCAIAASTCGDPRLLIVASCLRAIGFQRAWAAGTAEEIQVFDAMDSALRHLTMIHPPDAGLLDALALEVQGVPVKRFLARAMLPLFRASGSATGKMLPPASDDEPPIELNQVIWDSDPKVRAKGMFRILEAALELELDRGELEQEPPDPIAHAEWSNWSFQHPGYRRAVPHLRSLERERDADDIFLIIHHEATHVAAMTGGIGVAIMALRAAAQELELDLFSEYQLIDTATFAIKGVTPLGPPKMGPVYWAAHQLDLLAKMQTLQDVWNPWFEGLAVFAELCDNPTADDTATTAADILVQLIDIWGEAGQTAEEHRQALPGIRNRFEQQVVQTQRRLGPAKLQFYCEAMSAKYMGGFLAVRSVIGAWRRSVGELSGHAAIRLLLHITRFGTYSLAVPDLSLDPDDFAVAAQDAMVTWVRRIAELPADDIRFVVDNSTESYFRWSDQRVDREELSDEAELAEEGTETYRELVRRALHPASSIGRGSKLYFADHLFESWGSLLSVLPLGRTTARFWIDRTMDQLTYVVRTMEHRQDNDQPSYDVATVPLMPEEMDALEAAVTAHPFDRLTIARFAELYGDVPGFNAIALRLGDWTHIQAHGWALGSDAEISSGFEQAVKLRLDPNPALRMERNLIAAATGAAARTADWVTASWPTSDESDLPEEAQEILGQLATHAAEIRDHDGTAQERTVSERLVTEIIGDPQQAADLVEHGLAALTPYDPDLRTSAYEALLISGDEPAYAELNLPDGHPLHNLLVHGDTGWDVVPFLPQLGEVMTGELWHGEERRVDDVMAISAIILRDDFESAISAAKAMGTAKNVPGLASPLDAAWSGRINAVWDRIESALRTAFERGRDAAQSLTTKAIEQAQQLVADAGQRAYDVQQTLLSRLQAYVTRLTDAALGRVRPELRFGATTWRLEAVELAEKISLTGSLSANITSLVTVTADGELTVTAKYAVTTETTPSTSLAKPET